MGQPGGGNAGEVCSIQADLAKQSSWKFPMKINKPVFHHVFENRKVVSKRKG